MSTFRGASLFAATITMGIGAGVYLLFAFVIMPGLGKTDDRTFVGAFQQIDKAILGPFLLVFFVGPLAFTALAAVLHPRHGDRTALMLILVALVLELVATGITVVVHVPLNDGIKAAGDPGHIDVAAVRHVFDEARWVTWNNVRAGAATAAFASLTWASMFPGI